MTATAFSGPLVTNLSNPMGSTGTGSANQNPGPGPCNWAHGDALLDPRYPFTYYQGNDVSQKFYGWFGGTMVNVINAVPSALAANNIAASQTPGSAALTLVSASGAGITVGTSITRADTGATVTGLLAIDTAMAGVGFGQDATVNVWDPTKAIARNVRITSGGNDTGITFLVVGYDLYGYPMSEAITGANAGVASGVKAFKYIASITPSGAVATTASAGTGDVIGLPLRADVVGQLLINYNDTLITASTGFTAAVTTTATTTTGDVRGTYALQTASNGTRRLVMYMSPSVAAVAGANTNLVTGLVGVKQNLATDNGA